MSWLCLMIAIAGYSGLSLSMKLGGKRGLSDTSLAVALYISVTSLMGAWMLLGGYSLHLPRPVLGWAIAGGIAGGLCAFPYIRCLKIGPYGLTVAVLPMSAIVPIAYAAMFWGQPLRFTKCAGIAMVFAGLLLVFTRGLEGNTKQPRTRWLEWTLLMLAAFVLNGIPQIGMAAVSQGAPNGDVPLLFTYAVLGLVVTAVPAIRAREMPGGAMLYGAAAAVSVATGNFLTLKALESLDGSVVFPVSLSVPVIIGVILSRALFHERITAAGYAGTIIGLAGVSVLAVL